MTTLDRTLAFAQVDQVSVMIAHDLDFDVPGFFDQFLDVHFAIAEGALGFARGIAKSACEIGCSVDAAHSLSAPPAAALSITGYPICCAIVAASS